MLLRCLPSIGVLDPPDGLIGCVDATAVVRHASCNLVSSRMQVLLYSLFLHRLALRNPWHEFGSRTPAVVLP